VSLFTHIRIIWVNFRIALIFIDVDLDLGNRSIDQRRLEPTEKQQRSKVVMKRFFLRAPMNYTMICDGLFSPPSGSVGHRGGPGTSYGPFSSKKVPETARILHGVLRRSRLVRICDVGRVGPQRHRCAHGSRLDRHNNSTVFRHFSRDGGILEGKAIEHALSHRLRCSSTFSRFSYVRVAPVRRIHKRWAIPRGGSGPCLEHVARGRGDELPWSSIDPA